MLISVRQFAHRLAVAAALGLACFPAVSHAQESSLAMPTLTTPLGAIPAPSLSTANGVASAEEPHQSLHASIKRATEPARSRLGIFVPLYASFAGLQALDAHSTIRAMRNGGSERNPLLRDLADRPAALYALKAGVTASTILLTEKVRPKNRVAAIVLMAALDSFYMVVVVHNYRATR